MKYSVKFKVNARRVSGVGRLEESNKYAEEVHAALSLQLVHEIMRGKGIMDNMDYFKSNHMEMVNALIVDADLEFEYSVHAFNDEQLKKYVEAIERNAVYQYKQQLKNSGSEPNNEIH